MSEERYLFHLKYSKVHVLSLQRSQGPPSDGYYSNIGPAHSQTLPHHHRMALAQIPPMSPSNIDRQKPISQAGQPVKPQRGGYQPASVPKVVRSGQTEPSAGSAHPVRGGPIGGMGGFVELQPPGRIDFQRLIRVLIFALQNSDTSRKELIEQTRITDKRSHLPIEGWCTIRRPTTIVPGQYMTQAITLLPNEVESTICITSESIRLL